MRHHHYHPRPRLVVAFDFPTQEAAFTLLEKLDPSLCRLKVGITMFTRYGPAFVEALMQKGFEVFLDVKFHDIPYQVAGACRSAAELGIWMLSIHTLGGQQMCEAAANAIAHYSHRPLLIGVTILTSANQHDLTTIGIEKKLESSVQNLAELARNTGLDGVVCSPWEVVDLRKKMDENFVLVTPGIRTTLLPDDDQRRVTTPQKALEAGADYLVMGRSITQAENPRAIIESIHGSDSNL